MIPGLLGDTRSLDNSSYVYSYQLTPKRLDFGPWCSSLSWGTLGQGGVQGLGILGFRGLVLMGFRGSRV